MQYYYGVPPNKMRHKELKVPRTIIEEFTPDHPLKKNELEALLIEAVRINDTDTIKELFKYNPNIYKIVLFQKTNGQLYGVSPYGVAIDSCKMNIIDLFDAYDLEPLFQAQEEEMSHVSKSLAVLTGKLPECQPSYFFSVSQTTERSD